LTKRSCKRTAKQWNYYLPQPTKPHKTQIHRFSEVWHTIQIDFSDCCWQYRQTWKWHNK
jgi:hypothetical protein